MARAPIWRPLWKGHQWETTMAGTTVIMSSNGRITVKQSKTTVVYDG